MIVFAGMGMKRHWNELPSNEWSDRAAIASLMVGTCAIVAGFLGKVAWLRAGGDPHGMGTPNGIWVQLQRIFLTALVLSAVLALLGKGRGRVLTVLTLSALAVAFAANTMVYMLQMD
jgi:hypothetical protein